MDTPTGKASGRAIITKKSTVTETHRRDFTAEIKLCLTSTVEKEEKWKAESEGRVR